MNKLIYIIVFLPLFVRSQIISTYAGTGFAIYSGDNVPATTANIGYIASIATDTFGNLFIVDGTNNRIRKVDAVTGIISTIAGNGIAGYFGDGGQATDAKINVPTSGFVAVDDTGNVYLSDEFSFRIRKISRATGIITTISGNGTQHHMGDNGPASAASFGSVNCIAIDGLNNIYISDSGVWIRKINTAGIITTVAGDGILGYMGDGFAATNAQIACSGLTCDALNNLYITSSGNGRVRKVDVTTGVITTIAGDGSTIYNNGVPATATGVGASFIVFDNHGQLYLSEMSATYSRVRVIDVFNIINVVAGNGSNGFSGDGGAATLAKLNYPAGLAFDDHGNLYVADEQNKRIRKIVFPSTTANNIEKSMSKTIFFPNPVIDYLTIETQYDGIYLLFDVVGNVKRKGTLQNGYNKFSVGELPIGIYFVDVTDEEGNRTITKVVKQ